MTRPDPRQTYRLGVLTASAGLAAAVLVTAVTAAAGDHRPEFPLSVSDARDRAEARFQRLDADGSGEISPGELAAGDFPGHPGPRFRHHLRFAPGPAGEYPAVTDFAGPQAAMDAQLFERLDVNGDELLSKEEFASEKVHEARMALMQQRAFEHMDRDGSGGVSRDELPDMSQWLDAMDADDDGIVTREEARAHRQDAYRSRGRRGDAAAADTDSQG